MKRSNQICVVGLGTGYQDIPPSIMQCIEKADVLVGGGDLLDLFTAHPAEKIVIAAPLSGVLDRVSNELEAGKKIAVLASGDPGIYGIGKKIVEKFGNENVVILPNVSALQTAAARLRKPWEGIRPVSLHGRRDVQPLFNALVWNDTVGVFTDNRLHPGEIAGLLISRMVEGFRMIVLERLGQAGERIRSFDPADAVDREFETPNFVILERRAGPRLQPGPGLDDRLYEHEKGLITKREIRAVGLSMLQPGTADTLWDLGSGCGSVGIEASFYVRDGRILCVEKNPGRVRLIRGNIRRTGAYAVEVVQGIMPECLGTLPDPHRIFMGGGLGRDVEILAEAFRRLRPGGAMVLHLVLLGSLEKARGLLEDLGAAYELIQVQVSRTRGLAGDLRLDALNPVFILKALKDRDLPAAESASDTGTTSN